MDIPGPAGIQAPVDIQLIVETAAIPEPAEYLEPVAIQLIPGLAVFQEFRAQLVEQVARAIGSITQHQISPDTNLWKIFQHIQPKTTNPSP